MTKVTRFMGRAVRRAVRELRRLSYYFREPKGVLVYVGAHRGTSLAPIFRRYRICYVFEPNPQLFEALQRRYARYANVHLENAAVAEHDGHALLNVSSNDGASSSLGKFDHDFEAFKSGSIKVVNQIQVRSVNLLGFLAQRGVDRIDDYVSDIQGMDLTVLRTLMPMIASRRIGTITCEVAKDSRHNIYSDLPDNSETGFAALLQDNYDLVAVGWGSSLEDDRSEEIPDDWWEMDCKWRAKA